MEKYAKLSKENPLHMKRSRATGSGPPPKPPSTTTEKIIKLFENTLSFTGLKGFESAGMCYLCWASLGVYEQETHQNVLASLLILRTHSYIQLHCSSLNLNSKD